jgi:hypothetical protein
MQLLLYTVNVRLVHRAFVLLFLSSPAWGGNPQPAPTLRWVEGTPNCTLRFGEDGRTYYGVSSADFEITLAVDTQELEKVKRRTVPMIGVLISFKYRGTEPLPLLVNRSTLEFTKHFQVVMRAFDADTMLKQLQQSMDDLTDEIEHHQVRKHPELKDAKENELQQRLKDYTEMMDFISTQALRGSTLDPSTPSSTGWIFFSTKNRWIGPWRRPEQFVFRIPVENVVVEFPFELPPKGGKVQLRHRPGE